MNTDQNDTVSPVQITVSPEFTTVSAQRIADAIHGVAALDTSVWHDNATRFTCFEANAIADFLGVFVSPEEAIEFLACHAHDDDEGDQHFVIYADADDPDPYHVASYPVGVASHADAAEGIRP